MISSEKWKQNWSIKFIACDELSKNLYPIYSLSFKLWAALYDRALTASNWNNSVQKWKRGKLDVDPRRGDDASPKSF